MTVVSDDHRIRDAARRRHCLPMGCAEYLEWLERHRKQRRQPRAPEPGKPQGVSREETQHWLHEFADLAEDPDMKELFDPFGFEGQP